MNKLFQINDSHKIKYIFLKTEDDIYNTALEILHLIQTKYELNVIKLILKNQYNYLREKEQMFVIGECKKIIYDAEVYHYIVIQLCKFIREENILNIDGFIKFRLGEYIKHLENVIETVVTDYINDCEYNKIIKGLIMYLDFQQPLIDSIEIFSFNEGYTIKDCNGRKILNLYFYDDVLLDVMLTLAPNKIIIKNYNLFKNKELLNTLCKIFDKRVVLC